MNSSSTGSKLCSTGKNITFDSSSRQFGPFLAASFKNISTSCVLSTCTGRGLNRPIFGCFLISEIEYLPGPTNDRLLPLLNSPQSALGRLPRNPVRRCSSRSLPMLNKANVSLVSRLSVGIELVPHIPAVFSYAFRHFESTALPDGVDPVQYRARENVPPGSGTGWKQPREKKSLGGHGVSLREPLRTRDPLPCSILA
jgi:hypothetical protein